MEHRFNAKSVQQELAITVFQAKGELARLCREKDWSGTSLGHIESWPASLRTIAALVVNSPLPMILLWGDELVQIYNDGYRNAMGRKHPSGLGQPTRQCWPEVWEFNAPLYEGVVDRRETFCFENQRLVIERHGHSEEAYFTLGYSPVFDDQGAVGGVLVTVSETTMEVERQKAMATAGESEERFRLMANAVPQIVWITDSEGRVEFFNQQWSNYTGLTYNPETAAEVAAAVVHSDDVAITLERFEQAQKSGTAFLVEHRIRSASGDYRWFLVRADPYRDPGSGQISRWFGASVDIHDRKLAEEALRLQTARQTFQLELADRIRPLASPDEVITVVSELLGKHLGVARVVYAIADESGQTVSINRDWTDGTLTSMSGSVLQLDDFGPLMAGAVRAAEVLVVADVANDERSAAYADAYAENGIRSFVAIPLMKDGRLRAILNAHDSRPHYWTEDEIALAQDMVDRTWSAVESARAQAELRAERDQSQYIFDSMTEGFALVDKDWSILRMNAEGLRIAQRAAHEVIGKSHWDVWPELKDTPIEEVYQEVKATHKANSIDLPFTFPDGSNGWVEIRAYPSLDGGLAFFFRNISERKSNQDKLQDADRRKDEFLAMLAHELRNPLAPIGAAAELLQMVKLDEARVRQTSQIIGRQVDHMTGLVDDLLDVSRVTRGLVELDTAPIDISHIITDAIEQATPLIRSREHHLGMQLAADATLVLGDKKRLVQVVANLLSNAAKYTHEGGHILIRTEVRDTHVLLQISDDGIGMAPELVARAFDLFAQAERTSDRSSGGLGLGLALVKSLVELHQGTVTCESAGPGRGSKFTICLPRLLADARSKGSQGPAYTSKQSTNPLRIMVVDDNMDAAAMLAMLLEASGHQVVVEHSARRALERSKTDPTKVFLLDIGLPEMDGNELAQRLRAQPETAKSVLIAVTGYGQDNDRGRTLAAGFDHHLVKPVDTTKLANILAKIGLA